MMTLPRSRWADQRAQLRAKPVDPMKEKIRRNLKTMLLMGDDDSDMKAFADKVCKLQHQFRDGKLYVGTDFPPKHEVRKSAKTGDPWCRCPDFAFRSRKGGGLCKHLVYAQAAELEIPTTGDV